MLLWQRRPMEAGHERDSIIEKLAAAVAQLVGPPIPLEIDLWDIETISRYLKREAATVRDRMACLPGFPKAIRQPTTRGAVQCSGGDRLGPIVPGKKLNLVTLNLRLTS
jgi:hypothetical protein